MVILIAALGTVALASLPVAAILAVIVGIKNAIEAQAKNSERLK